MKTIMRTSWMRRCGVSSSRSSRSSLVTTGVMSLEKRGIASFNDSLTSSTAKTSHLQGVRNFSSSLEEDGNSSLSQILSEEILEETTKREEEVDEDYDDVKKYVTSVFKLSERVGYGEVLLTRSLNDETITVKFDCQDETNDNGDDDLSNQQIDFDLHNQEHEVNEEDAENVVDNYGIHFEVSVAKSNGDKAVFNCVATSHQPRIMHVNFISSNVDEADSAAYGGPRYEDLDPAVKGAFQHYLTERGIDEDLSFFIIQHSRYKEESEYLHWLKSLNEFVNN